MSNHIRHYRAEAKQVSPRGDGTQWERKHVLMLMVANQFKTCSSAKPGNVFVLLAFAPGGVGASNLLDVAVGKLAAGTVDHAAHLKDNRRLLTPVLPTGQ